MRKNILTTVTKSTVFLVSFFVLIAFSSSVVAIPEESRTIILLDHGDYSGLAEFITSDDHEAQDLAGIVAKIDDYYPRGLDEISHIIALVARLNFDKAWEMINLLDHTGDDTVEILVRMMHFSPVDASTLLQMLLVRDGGEYVHDTPPLNLIKIEAFLTELKKVSLGEASELKKNIFP